METCSGACLLRIFMTRYSQCNTELARRLRICGRVILHRSNTREAIRVPSPRPSSPRPFIFLVRTGDAPSPISTSRTVQSVSHHSLRSAPSCSPLSFPRTALLQACTVCSYSSRSRLMHRTPRCSHKRYCLPPSPAGASHSPRHVPEPTPSHEHLSRTPPAHPARQTPHRARAAQTLTLVLLIPTPGPAHQRRPLATHGRVDISSEDTRYTWTCARTTQGVSTQRRTTQPGDTHPYCRVPAPRV